MNAAALEARTASQWDSEIVPEITEYIRIPAKSPHFDPQWEANGHIERVIRLAEALGARAAGRRHDGARSCGSPGRTPVLFFDVPANGTKRDGTVLLYGHLDKQPEMIGWREDLGPWQPVRRTASSTAAAAPTTAMRCSPRSPRSARCRRRACRMRVASA